MTGASWNLCIRTAFMLVRFLPDLSGTAFAG
jgi:hypothetical protein